MSTQSPTLPELNLYEIGLWCIRQRHRFTIVGPSMQPQLYPGDVVLVNPQAYHHCHPQVGDIVVARHPWRSNFPIIKRVLAVDAQGLCTLQGDNASYSTDSRTFGVISGARLLGKVTCRFHRAPGSYPPSSHRLSGE